MKGDKRKSFVFMTDWIPIIRILTKEETDTLFSMIKAMIEGKDVPAPNGKNLPDVWEFIKDKLTDNIDHYEEVKKRRLANLEKANAKRKLANAEQKDCKCKPNADHMGGVTVTDTVTDTVTVPILPNGSIGGDSQGEGKPPRPARPSKEEIEKFILDNGYEADVNADTFFDYYEANGWKVGKNSMKDWKATVRMWASRERKTKTEAQFF